MNEYNDLMTVQEWTDKCNLLFKDFDGFVYVYRTLASDEDKSIENSFRIRFQDAKTLYCNRRGFIAGIKGCSREFPEYDKLSTMVDIVPEFVEQSVDSDLYYSAIRIKEATPDASLFLKLEKMLLEAFKLKIVSRTKSLELNSDLISTDRLLLDKEQYHKKESSIAKKFNGNLEQIEQQIIDECAIMLEKINLDNPLETENIPFDLIEVLCYLSRQVRRNDFANDKSIKYLLIKMPGEKKEDFILPFRLFNSEGVKHYVAFDGDGIGTGMLEVTEEIEEKVRKKQMDDKQDDSNKRKK